MKIRVHRNLDPSFGDSTDSPVLGGAYSGRPRIWNRKASRCNFGFKVKVRVAERIHGPSMNPAQDPARNESTDCTRAETQLLEIIKQHKTRSLLCDFYEQ